LLIILGGTPKTHDAFANGTVEKHITLFRNV